MELSTIMCVPDPMRRITYQPMSSLLKFVIQIWMIIIANGDDSESDYNPDGPWLSFIYTAQVFVGTADLTGVVNQKIAHA